MPEVRRAAIASIALAIALTACSSGGSGGDAQPSVSPSPTIEPLALVREASRDLSKETVEATFAMTVEGGQEHVAIEGEIQTDPVAERARFTMLTTDPETGQEAELEGIVDTGALYLRAGALIDDDKWVKIDVGGESPFGQFDPTGMGSPNPGTFLQYIRGAGTPEIVGTETVNGAETTHLSGTIDLSKAEAAVPAPARDDYRESLRELEDLLGRPEATYDIWVDGEGVTRRVIFSFGSQEQGTVLTVRMDVVRIGGPVDIEIPKPSEVIDLGTIQLPGQPGG